MQFEAQQAAMMRAGDPDTPCGRCGCRRDRHLPGRTFSHATSGASSGKSHEVPVLAPTCCVCKYCFCFCTAFVEPFEGQPWLACIYDPEQSLPEIPEVEFQIIR
jgi:hypothetical protein